MADNFSSFVTSCEDVLKQLINLYELETDKQTGLLSYDIALVDNVVKTQQALLMHFNLVEKKRLTAQAQAGFQGLTSSQILEKVDNTQRDVLKPIFDSLMGYTNKLKVLNKASLDIATAELNIISEGAPTTDTNNLYNPYKKSGGRSFSTASFEGKF